MPPSRAGRRAREFRKQDAFLMRWVSLLRSGCPGGHQDEDQRGLRPRSRPMLAGSSIKEAFGHNPLEEGREGRHLGDRPKVPQQ